MTRNCPGVHVDDRAASTLAMWPAPHAALFLDRDGVINIDRGYVHTADQTEFTDGIFALCAAARGAGLAVIVVTNQAGIARGLYTEEKFLEYTDWMHGEFRRRGTPLLATYYCPHHPTAGTGEYLKDCDCRKPAPGMLLQALRDYGIDPARSLLVGDKPKDMQAAFEAGIGRRLLLGDRPVLAPSISMAIYVGALSEAVDIVRLEKAC